MAGRRKRALYPSWVQGNPPRSSTAAEHTCTSVAVTPEQMELSRLRAENKRLQMELEIAKKAAAYFAKDLL